MDSPSQWYFSKEDLASTPSRKNGIDSSKELSYRQQAANFIQDMGQRLQVSQLCINTAIVYMHRFYVFHSFTEVHRNLCINTGIVYMHRFYMYHSFTKFHRNNLSVAALFLAAKVEEQPRKLEHVIKVAHICLHKDAPPLDVRSEAYAEKQFEVVNNESVLLQTLGFMLAIDHPHTYVVKVCQLVKACKDLAQTSYFMATTSLHMTTMCLQYRPTLVACVCIHLACKWSSWKIEPCSEGKEWYYYVDRTVTIEILENLTQEFIAILETSPHKFKKKFISQKPEPISHTPRNALESSSKHSSTDKPVAVKKEPLTPGPSTLSFSVSQVVEKPTATETNDKLVVPSQSGHSPQTPKKNKVPSHPISLDAYREKKERERLEHKPIPPVSVESSSQPVVSRPQHATSDHDRSQKHISNSLEPHSQSTREKAGRSSVGKPPSHHHQVLSSSSKLNHHFSKKLDPVHSKESIKGDLSKLSSTVVNDPVVVLERVDVKPPREILAPEIASASRVVTSTVTNPHESKYSKPVENAEPVAPVVQVAEPPAVVTKSKHHKHKTNSLRPNHNSVDFHQYKRSPPKDINTNGSKEAESVEKRSVENSILNTKTPDAVSKHEKREKYKTKHSYNSSKNKVYSEPSNPAIKVKIRKEDINKLPEKSHKFEPSVKVESPKKSLKIKISKPPVVPETVKSTTPLKLVITKDKSGSGSYCMSHKNERESKKRAHSPHDANLKSTEETPNKYAKLDHGHTSHSSTKQSKSRHSSSRTSNNVSSGNKLLNQGKDASGYLNVDVENYASQPYFSNQYNFPYQPGYRGKTNFNQIPQPPPPPE